MAHQSLYRKYRPQGFDDIVGQSHITRTLRNAVAEDAVAHAYLFTGPRGTGKTTTARILAKALECEKGPTADPDLSCDQCIDIAEGRHPDVHELDAASHTGVENVREEIIGRLQYATTRGRYKVYIIDEVHMLSNSAFNALLKSIEEPPSHTVFILCTTHPNKVPETIHSRCQRFDFHRIGIDDLVERLKVISEKEGISVAEGSLTLVAKHAAGGMRDAISTLEQLSTFTGKQIELADVEGLLGEVDSSLLFELADLIADRDIAGSFRFVAGLAESGIDMGEFVRDLTSHMRDLYVAAAVGDATGIIDSTSEQLSRLTSQSVRFGSERLGRILDLLGELGGQMRWSSDPRLVLEVTLTRMARPQSDLTLEALAERLEVLEAGTPIATTPPVRKPTQTDSEHDSADETSAVKTQNDGAAEEAEPSGKALAGDADVEQPAPASSAPDEPVIIEAPSSAKLDRAAAKRAWPGVLAEIRKIKTSRATFFVNTEVDVDADGHTMVVEFPADARFMMKQAGEPETRKLLNRALGTVLGFPPEVRFQLGRGAVREAEDVDTGASAPVPASSQSAADVEKMLVDELGAQVIAEHAHSDQEEGTES